MANNISISIYDSTYIYIDINDIFLDIIFDQLHISSQKIANSETVFR